MKTFYEKTQKQQVEIWENVLRVLRSLTPHERKKHWNMADFIEETPCGTVCCAAGHCAFDSWFMKRGWKAERNEFGLNVWNANIHDYFGEVGSRGIFHNFDSRPVGQVIKEVRAHIKKLKAAKEYKHISFFYT